MYWPCSVPQIYTHHIQLQATVRPSSVRDNDVSYDNAFKDEDNGPGRVELERAEHDSNNSGTILDLKVAQSEHFFATLSHDIANLWSCQPVALLVVLQRSPESILTYGHNRDIHFKPDASILIIRTSLSYLLLYSVQVDTIARVLQIRKVEGNLKRSNPARATSDQHTQGLGEVILRFRKAIKIDAGISSLAVSDSDLLVSTERSSAIQCIRWETQKGAYQTNTQILSKLDWMESRSAIKFMVHNRAMDLSIWLNESGMAYAVRRLRPQQSLQKRSSSDASLSSTTSQPQTRLFDGYRFYNPSSELERAGLIAINARFSLIALSTEAGNVMCFAAKDYNGNIPLSHKFVVGRGPKNTIRITVLSWSPDGHCLFVGYDSGWSMYSVFGKLLFSTFSIQQDSLSSSSEDWVSGILLASWYNSGASMFMTVAASLKIFRLDFARSAATSYLSGANLFQALQHTSDELRMFRDSGIAGSIANTSNSSLHHHVPCPQTYLRNQGTLRVAVTSRDGRYIAVAGRRGLGHYSTSSGRWKMFSDPMYENSFAVRGGMCWLNHVLIVATEHVQGYDVRLYLRSSDLGRVPVHSVPFTMPVVFIGTSGDDSLLVYTYENVLYHFVLDLQPETVQLYQLGQIALHGIVRAPSRVRSVSWILPKHQHRNGDPSKDVEHAAILFLIDDKLVLLNPSRTPGQGIKYELKVIVQQVEYYILMRDQHLPDQGGQSASVPSTPFSETGSVDATSAQASFHDSLWIFNGQSLQVWLDVSLLLRPTDTSAVVRQSSIEIPVDFYPLCISITKAIAVGFEALFVHKKDLKFSQFWSKARTQLFLPYVLKYQILDLDDTDSPLALTNQFKDLPYFTHALEVLLHIVLEEESTRRGSTVQENRPEPLPAILTFLQMASSPPVYLALIVQCIRKTEVSYWRYLFAHLPPAVAMFEQAIELGDLKTASGYLIVLQTLDEEDEGTATPSTRTHNEMVFEDRIVRLMRLARKQHDYELCSELTRFLIGIDLQGDLLRRVLEQVGFTRQRFQISSTPEGPRNSLYLQPGKARLSTKNIVIHSRSLDKDSQVTSVTSSSERQVDSPQGYSEGLLENEKRKNEHVSRDNASGTGEDYFSIKTRATS